MPQDAIVESWKKIAFDTVGSHAVGYAVPLIGAPDATPFVHGTGSLLRMRGRTFLVTAAHVAKEAKNRHTSIPLRTRRQWFKVRGYLHFTADAETDSDVGLLEFQDDPSQLLKEYPHLTIDDVYTGEEGLPRYCLLSGYSARATSLDDPFVPTRPPIMLLEPYHGSRDLPHEGATIDPRIHFLLQHREEGFGIHGEKKMLPPPYGMSGSLVWGWVNAAQDGSVWDPAKSIKVVAVQTDYLKNRWIRCTHWGVIARMIYEVIPGLRDDIASVYGEPPPSAADSG